MNDFKKTRVVVAMSGGVDSSVTAAILADQGYDVIGIMLRLWSEPGQGVYNRCCSPDSMQLARQVAGQLGIPFYTIDARETFRDTVVGSFIDGYLGGITPNPCLLCNSKIRWEFLLKRAIAIGAEHMATGHYARLNYDKNGKVELLRAIDQHKDQSYVLHLLNQEKLKHALFPLGEYTKDQVRKIAKEFKLPVANRADSQDLCFLGDGDYRQFLIRNAPKSETPGPILNRDREVLGRHQGLAFYTIGQRRGLGISSSQALYVLEKDVPENALIVGFKAELGKTSLIAKNTNWITGEPPKKPLRATVKIRYKAREAEGIVTPMDNQRIHVRFESPLRDITPGQAAVVYQNERCLGGGIIASSD